MRDHADILRQRTPKTTDLPHHGRRGYDLPPELLAKGRTRLELLALLFSCFCVVGIVAETFLGTKATHLFFYLIYITNGVISTIVWAISRSKRFDHGFALNVGLVYEVVMCLIVSVGVLWGSYLRTGILIEITWVCILIVAFPLIIPSPPKRTFVAALLTAATVPVGLTIIHAMGIAEPGFPDYLGLSVSPLLCVVVAIAGSRVVYGLNVDVAKARQMGSYRLVEMLGKGGMGEVWRAEHKLLARPAAIKLITSRTVGAGSTGTTETLIKRFEREAQTTASLESEHSVQLYDFGVSNDGRFYYVMELLQGLDLDKLIKEFGPIRPERAIYILLQACHSLAEAHQRGLVHRDIKPTNIFLCQKGLDYDYVKVLDFGLVKSVFEAPKGETKLTVDGTVSGTPAYIAPETALGQEIDGRTDIYALGCVAYWLLSGQLVFESESAMKMIADHLNVEPIRLSERTEIAVPLELENVIHSCLQKDPNERPQNASELAQRLEEIDVPKPWDQELARQWWSMHLPTPGTSDSTT